MPFTLRNLKQDLDDVGSNFDGARDLEFRLATDVLKLERSGLCYQRVPPGVAVVDITPSGDAPAPRVDKTQLLLLGQEREAVSIVIDRDTVTVAARFDSGLDFLKLLGLSGGMPTRVSVPRARLGDLLRALGVSADALVV